MLKNPRLIFYILIANLLLLMFARQIDSPLLFLIIILVNFFICTFYPVVLLINMLKMNKYIALAISFLLTSIVFYVLNTTSESLNTGLFILFFINLFSISVAFVNRYRMQKNSEL